MPGWKTHDAITFLLAPPAFAVTYAATASLSASVIVAGAFIFGGVMFGPDLDTVSRQYSRWFIFRFLWFPYRSFFKHRSRFSHGLIFGAFGRVVYFMGALTLLAFAAGILWTLVSGQAGADIAVFTNAWQKIGALVRRDLGENFLWLTFLGLWFGAASHTFTDMAGSFIKTGRIAKFL